MIKIWSSLHSQTTPYSSPLRASYGVPFASYTNKNDHDLSRAHCTVYPKKYAHGFCFAVLCCGYTLTDFPISTRLTSLALWQSNDCPSASKATLMNMDKYFMWIHYERLHNHNKAKHNKTVCIFLGLYCTGTIAWGAHEATPTNVDKDIRWPQKSKQNIICAYFMGYIVSSPAHR